MPDYLFWIFSALLGCSPLWLGGNRLFAWGLHAILFGGLLVVFELYLVLTRRRHPVEPSYLLVPFGLIAAAVAWILIQTVTIVPVAWQHPIWSIASDILNENLAGSVSVNRELTAIALVRLLTAFSVFWIALQLCRKAQRANNLLLAFVVIGFVYSLYGILALVFTPSNILWFEKTAYQGFVTSTFVNRNSFASFAGVTLLATIGITVRLFQRNVDHGGAGWRLMLANAIEAVGRQGIFLFAMIFTIVMALLLSGSRAGITATGFGIFVLAVFVMARAERRRSAQVGTLASAGIVMLIAFLGYGDVFVGRLDSVVQDAGGRIVTYNATISSILGAPVLGFGYGTFQDVFAMYQDGSGGIWGRWDKAHNTYLEIFQGLGLVFGGLFLAGIGLLVWRCAAAAVARRRTSTVPIVAFASSALLGVHALVDFSLQIQSITLLWSALLGAGVAQSWSSRQDLDVV